MEAEQDAIGRSPGEAHLRKQISDLRADGEAKDKHIAELLHEINGYTNTIQDLIAENGVLKSMNNVPDNYGLDISSIKLRDKEKVEDYKKLIQVLQHDNYSLEKERAELKNLIKRQSMMYNENDPEKRYKGLDSAQLA